MDRPPRRRRAQQGQTLVLTAILFAGVIGLLMAAVANLASVIQVFNSTETATTVGSREGALDVDADRFYATGQLALAPDAAARCEAAVSRQLDLAPQGIGARSVTCSATSRAVTADVHVNVHLFVLLDLAGVELTSTHTSNAVFGRATPKQR